MVSFICAEVLVLMNFALVGASDDKTSGTQLYIEKCNSKELWEYCHKLYEIQNQPSGVLYIRSALSNLIDVWDSHILQPELDESNLATPPQGRKRKQKVYEDGFRITVIAKLLDAAFLHSSDAKVLRSEITPLFQKKSANSNKVDFILRHDDKFDTVLGEEKPPNSSKRSIVLDKVKCELMRTQYLQHYLKSVPKEYKDQLEVISINWAGYTIHIRGTKQIAYKEDNVTPVYLHYELAKLVFPHNSKQKNAIPMLAHFMKAVLQLKVKKSIIALFTAQRVN
ncbi:hypothetical protein BJV82DRAFT_394103 [Fennellomyces sp. T-0311]|nr:hypothetical protein BJV82DRAFT_394103 [Fennellomyces sp. T-0311]